MTTATTKGVKQKRAAVHAHVSFASLRDWHGIGMFMLSVVTFVVAWTYGLTSTSPLRSPFSVEILAGNPMAIGLIVLIGIDTYLFARRLVDNGHVVRTVVISLDVAGLIVGMLVAPTSAVHGIVVCCMILLSIVWFAVMATDYGLRELTYSTLVPLVILPFIASVDPADGERVLITYFLWMINVFYYRHMPAGIRRWD